MWSQTSRIVASLAIVALGLLLPLAPWQASRAQTCNVRVVLETPDEGATVEPQQTIIGWAVDLAATSGTGIDAVVASLDGAIDSPDNRLIGVAEYGAPRPEIGTNLGEERFGNSGFAFLWDTATALTGTHQLYVQAHSACGWHTANRPVTIGSAMVAAPAADAAPAVPAPASSAAGPAGGTTPSTSGVVVMGGTATPLPGSPTATATTGASPAGTPGALVITPGVITPLPTSTTLAPPDNLRLLATTSTGVTLAWDAPTGTSPAGYLIYQSSVLPGGGNAPPAVIGRVPGNVTTVTINGLQDPTRYTYYFTVSSIEASGTSASPYVLTSVSTTPLNTRVPLPPTPVGGATVVGASAAAIPGTTPAAGTATATSATGAVVPTPTPGGPFAPSAIATGSGLVTVVWPVQTGAASYNVYGASALAVSSIGQQPLVGAGPISALASAAPGTWVPVGSNVAVSSTTVSGLAPGGIYDFLVRAVSASGQEISQSTTSRVTLPLTVVATAAVPTVPVAGTTPLAMTTPGTISVGSVPSAPGGSGFNITVTSPSSTSLTLSWPPQPGATTYGVTVARGTTGGNFVADSSRSNLTTTTTTIDSLTAGSQFTFQIVARDAQGREIARSPPAPATVGQTMPPGAPGPLGTGPLPLVPTAIATSFVPGAGMMPPVPGAGATGTIQLTSNPSEPGTANLQWTQVPGATTYVVLGGPVGGQLQPVIPTTSNAAAYIPNLPPGQMQFQVSARDATGRDVGQSNPITVAIVPR